MSFFILWILYLSAITYLRLGGFQYTHYIYITHAKSRHKFCKGIVENTFTFVGVRFTYVDVRFAIVDVRSNSLTFIPHSVWSVNMSAWILIRYQHVNKTTGTCLNVLESFVLYSSYCVRKFLAMCVKRMYQISAIPKTMETSNWSIIKGIQCQGRIII